MGKELFNTELPSQNYNGNINTNETFKAINTISSEVNKAQVEINKLDIIKRNNYTDDGFNINLTSQHDLSNVNIPLNNIYTISRKALDIKPYYINNNIDDDVPDTSSFEDTIIKQRKNIDELISNNEDLKKELKVRQERIERLETDNKTLSSEKEVLEKQLLTSQQLLKQNEDDLFIKLKKFLTQIGDKTKGYKESLKKGELLRDGKKYVNDLNYYLDICFKILMDQIDINNGEIENDKKEIEDLKRERLELRENLDNQRKHLDKLIIDLESYKKKYEQGRVDFDENIKFLMAHINEQEASYNLLNEQLAVQQRTNLDLTEQIRLLNEQDAEKTARITDLIRERTDLQDKLTARTGLMIDYFEENMELKRQIEELKHDNDTLTAEKIQLEAVIFDNQTEIDILNIQVEMKVDEVAGLQAQLEAKDNRYTVLQILVETKNTEIGELKTIIATKNNDLRLLRDNRNNLNRQLEEKAEELRIKDVLILVRTAERDNERRERLRLTDMINAKDVEIEYYKESLRLNGIAYNHLTEQNEILNQQLAQSLLQNQEITLEKDQLSAYCSILRARLNVENRKYRYLKFKKNEISKNLQMANTEIKKQEKVIENLQNEIAQKDKLLAVLLTSLTVAQASASQEEINKLKLEIKSLQDNLKKETRNLNKNKRGIGYLRGELERRGAKIADLDNEIRLLTIQSQTKNRQLIIKDDEKTALQLRIAVLEEELGNANRLNNAKDTELKIKEGNLDEFVALIERNKEEFKKIQELRDVNLHGIINKSQGICQNLLTLVYTLREKLEKKDVDYKSLYDDLVRFSDYSITLQITIKQISEAKEELEKKNDDLIEENSGISRNLEESGNENLLLIAQMDEMRKENKQAMENMRREKEQATEELGREKEQAMEEMKRGNEQAMENMRREKEQAMENMRREKEQAMEEMKRGNEQAMEEMRRENKEAMDELMQRNEALQKSITDERKISEDNSVKINSLNRGIDILKKLYQTLMQEKNTFKEKFIEMKTKFEDQCEQNTELRTQIDGILKINGMMNDIIEQLRREVTEKDSEIVNIKRISSSRKKKLLAKTKMLKKMTDKFYKEQLIKSQLNGKIRELIVDTGNMSRDIHTKLSTIRKLRKTIKTLEKEGKVVSLENEREKLQSKQKIETLEQEIRKMRAIIDSKTNDLDEITNIIRSIPNTSDDKKGNELYQGTDIKKDLSVIKNEIDRLMQFEIENGSLQDQLDDINRLLEVERKKNETLNLSMAELRSTIDNKTDENLPSEESKKSQFISVTEFFTHFEDPIHTFKYHLQKFKLQVDENYRRYEELETSNNQIIHELKRELEAERKMKEDAERKMKEAEIKSREALEAEKKSRDELEAEIKLKEALEAENTRINKELEAEIKKNNESDDKITSLKKKLYFSKIKSFILTKVIDRNKSESKSAYEKLERINAELERKNLQQERIILDKESEITRLNTKISEDKKKLGDKIKKQKTRTQDLYKLLSINQKISKGEKLSRSNRGFHNKIKKDRYFGKFLYVIEEKKEESLYENLASIIPEIDTRAKEIEDLEEKVLQSEHKADQSKQENKQLQEENKSIGELNIQLSQSNESLQKSNTDKDAQIKQLNLQIGVYKRGNKEFETKIQGLELLRATNVTLLEENKKLKLEIKTRDTEIQKKDEEITRISKDVDVIEEQSKASLAEIKSQIETEVKERTQQISESNEKYALENTKLQRDVLRLTKTHDSTEEKIIFLEQIEKLNSKNFLYKLYSNKTDKFDQQSIDFYDTAYKDRKIKDIIKIQLDKIKYNSFKNLFDDMKSNALNELGLDPSIRFIYAGYKLTTKLQNHKSLFENLLDIFKRNIFDNLNEFMRLIELLNPILVIEINTDTSFCVGLIKELLYGYLIRMLNSYFKGPIMENKLCDDTPGDDTTPKNEFIQGIIAYNDSYDKGFETNKNVEQDNDDSTDHNSDEVNEKSIDDAIGTLVDTRFLYKNNIYKPDINEINELIEMLVEIAENENKRDDIEICINGRLKDREKMIRELKEEILPLAQKDKTVTDIRDKINIITNKNSNLVSGGGIASTLFLMFFNKYVCVLIILLLVLLYFYFKCQRQKTNYRKSYRNYLLTINQNLNMKSYIQ